MVTIDHKSLQQNFKYFCRSENENNVTKYVPIKWVWISYFDHRTFQICELFIAVHLVTISSSFFIKYTVKSSSSQGNILIIFVVNCYPSRKLRNMVCLLMTKKKNTNKQIKKLIFTVNFIEIYFPSSKYKNFIQNISFLLKSLVILWLRGTTSQKKNFFLSPLMGKGRSPTNIHQSWGTVYLV